MIHENCELDSGPLPASMLNKTEPQTPSFGHVEDFKKSDVRVQYPECLDANPIKTQRLQVLCQASTVKVILIGVVKPLTLIFVPESVRSQKTKLKLL